MNETITAIVVRSLENFQRMLKLLEHTLLIIDNNPLAPESAQAREVILSHGTQIKQQLEEVDFLFKRSVDRPHYAEFCHYRSLIVKDYVAIRNSILMDVPLAREYSPELN